MFSTNLTIAIKVDILEERGVQLNIYLMDLVNFYLAIFGNQPNINLGLKSYIITKEINLQKR